MKMNSLLEFTELLKNRLSDILFQEAENDRYINLYLVDGYWTAFENRPTGFVGFMDLQ
ncbi:hypothetical protein [Phocaeicola sp.]|uniref:hypothetical protein n=1 Tax=Phocaeicola sp. TaxID=2773926 RepID=UPI004027DA58